MTSVGNLAEGRLEDNAENIVKGHNDTDEKRNKGKARCRRTDIFSLSLHKFKQDREFLNKLCAPACDKLRLAEDLIEQSCYIRVVNAPCD